jgi:hypothetical protein
MSLNIVKKEIRVKNLENEMRAVEKYIDRMKKC